MKAVRKEHWKARQNVEEQREFINDRFWFSEGGGKSTEKKIVTLQREKLYEEIWTLSLSKVAKTYEVPYQKLKRACEESQIPLPSQSYWGNLAVGNSVQRTPLPESSCHELTITFHTRTGSSQSLITSQEQIVSCLGKTEYQQNEKHNANGTTTDELETEPSKSSNGGNLYGRETLYEEVWLKPVTKVAERYGVSNVMIHKVCKALDVPVPPRGYWAKKAAGQTVEKPPLPMHIGEAVSIGKAARAARDIPELSQIDESLNFLEDNERFLLIKTALDMQVNPAKRKLHPVLMQHKADYSAWAKKHPRDAYAAWKKDSYRHTLKEEPPLYERVSENALPRLYHILDAIYIAIEELGGSINPDLSIHIRGEHVPFSVTEGQEQVKHALTREELKQIEKYEHDKRSSRYAYEPKFRKYDYLPTGRLTFTVSRDSYIRDSDKAGLETRVGEMLLNLYKQSEVIRIEREAREVKKRKEEEERRLKELRRQAYNDEIDRLAQLENEIKDYEMACRIRAYLTAVAAQPNLSAEQQAWIEWASAKADWFDPIIDAEEPALGKRDHRKPKKPEKVSIYW